MKEQSQPNSNQPGENELVITRLIDAARERLFEGWIDPELLKQWFAPLPFMVAKCEIDPRPGCVFLATMRTPDGAEFPMMTGVFLEVSAPQRVVFTNAFTVGWRPSPQSSFVAVVTLEEEGGKTRYTICARTRCKEDRDALERSGFDKHWNQSLDQLVALVNQK